MSSSNNKKGFEIMRFFKNGRFIALHLSLVAVILIVLFFSLINPIYSSPNPTIVDLFLDIFDHHTLWPFCLINIVYPVAIRSGDYTIDVVDI